MEVPLIINEDTNKRLEALENNMKVKEAEIKGLKEELLRTQNEAKIFRSELKIALENITKAVLEKVTDSLVKVVNEKQDVIEKRNSAQLDSLHEQLTLLSRQRVPSAADVSRPPNQHPQPPQKQCDVCGKTFGSNRALENHVRNDHKPRS